MRIYEKCRSQTKDILSFYQKQRNILNNQSTSRNHRKKYSLSSVMPRNKLGHLTMFIWILFLPIIIAIAKNKNISRKKKTIWIIVLSISFLLFVVFAPKNDTGRSEKTSSSLPDQVINSDPPKNTDKTVYVTPTGTKYHSNSQCGGSNSTKIGLSEAKNIGLSPCGRCVK